MPAPMGSSASLPTASRSCASARCARWPPCVGIASAAVLLTCWRVRGVRAWCVLGVCSQDQPSSYKTKACRSFARTGRCPYGQRCRFMHGDVADAHRAEDDDSDHQSDEYCKPVAGQPPLPAHAPSSGSGSSSLHQSPYAGPVQTSQLHVQLLQLQQSNESCWANHVQKQLPARPHDSQVALGASTMRRRSSSNESGSTASEEATRQFDYSSSQQHTRHMSPHTPPHAPTRATSTATAADSFRAQLPPNASPAAVLLPYAQLPRGDGQEGAPPGALSSSLPQKVANFAWSNAACLGAFSPAGACGCGGLQPMTALPTVVTPSPFTSPCSSMASRLPSTHPSNASSAVHSELPSPSVLPLPHGASSIPPGPMPPAFLPPPAMFSATSALSVLELPVHPFGVSLHEPTGAGSIFSTVGNLWSSGAPGPARPPVPAPAPAPAPAPVPAPGTASQTAASRLQADPHVSLCGSGSSSDESNSTDLGGGGDGAFEGCLAMGVGGVHAAVHANRKYHSMTRSSIAKELSVLFDEAPADASDGAAGKDGVELSRSVELIIEPDAVADRTELALSDYSTARLAGQLAALCCSPSRREHGAEGASTPTSRW
jgi:hypothetical protein